MIATSNVTSIAPILFIYFCQTGSELKKKILVNFMKTIALVITAAKINGMSVLSKALRGYNYN